MRPVSDRFLEAVRRSHRVRSTADILYAGVTLVENLNVVSGEVTLDRAAAARGRADVTVAEPELVPSMLTGGPLTPFGYELRVRRGVVYSDGTEELVTLGTLPIQTSSVDEPGKRVRISALDRSQLVRDARFGDPVTIDAGVNYVTAIQGLILEAVRSTANEGLITFDFITTTGTTPVLNYDRMGDRWDAVLQMASSLGNEVFFNADGVCVMRKIADLTDAPVLSVDEGEDGILVNLALSFDRQSVYNWVIVSGENSSNEQVYAGLAYDNDPSSPTYFFGTFGKKPIFQGSGYVTSDLQADAMAEGILRSRQGVAYGLDFGAVVNPALEPGDVVQVKRATLDQLHLIDSLTIPLAADGVMSGTTRSR